MQLSHKRAKLSPMLCRAKVLLLVMSAILIFANLFLLSSTRDLTRSYSEQKSQGTWFLFQLTKEFSELTAISQYSRENPDYTEQVKLKYELTWSRFDLLLNNREADTFASLPGTRPFFQSMFNDFKMVEPRLDLIDNEFYAREVSNKLSKIYWSMIQYVNTNFRVNSPLFQEQLDTAKLLNKIQFTLLLLLCFCAGLAGFIIHQEAKYHRQLSLTDTLTKVKSRLAMFNELNKQIEEQNEFYLFLLDLNGFKRINDEYGHQAGDKALTQVATRLSKLGMPCYRIGGDEFALMTHNRDLDASWQQIEACFKSEVSIGHQKTAKLSTSIGVARFPTDADQLTQLISIADANMYKMKFANQNKSLVV